MTVRVNILAPILVVAPFWDCASHRFTDSYDFFSLRFSFFTYNEYSDLKYAEAEDDLRGVYVNDYDLLNISQNLFLVRYALSPECDSNDILSSMRLRR